MTVTFITRDMHVLGEISVSGDLRTDSCDLTFLDIVECVKTQKEQIELQRKHIEIQSETIRCQGERILSLKQL